MPPRSRRGVAVVSSGGGGRSAAERLAALTGRLTDRDRTLCRLLHQHRVLTTPQLIDLAFPSRNAAEHRLAILHQLGVLDRFRPHHTPGSAPYHYVLGSPGRRPAGRRGRPGAGPARLPPRPDPGPGPLPAAGASAGRQQLLLCPRPRRPPGSSRTPRWRCGGPSSAAPPSGAGWSTPTATAAGANSRPGWTSSWSTTGAANRSGGWPPSFPATSSSPRPARSPPRCCWWLPTPAREAAARQALSGSSLPVATATPHPDQTPAGPLWLPLHTSGRRHRLAQLASTW